MFRSGLLFLLNLALFMFLFFGCGQGDDQRKFEQEAFSYPDGFTQTNHNEEIINGNEDPDDWRVAPFYQGLVFVDPAFPNPVLTNEQLTIRIHLPYIDTITDLNVYVLRDVNNYQFLRQESAMPLVNFILNPLDIAEFSENPQGLYRIIILDNNDNVVTYGDVKIQ